MILYYLILFLVVFLWSITKKNREGKGVYFHTILCLLITISTLRGYTIGGDLGNYIPLFKDIDDNSWSHMFTTYNKYGIVFQLIIKLACIFSNNTTWILLIFSIINISGPSLFIRKFSKIPWLSFFLYIALAYYTNTFNSIRSSMALSFGMLGMIYLLQAKNKLAFLWFIIAFEVHKTIFPIFLMLYLKKSTPSFWKLAIPICGCLVMVNALGIMGFVDILSLYNSLNNYGGQGDFEMGGSGYGLLTLDILITFGCYFITRNRMTYIDAKLIIILCLATCIQSFATIYSLLTRIAFFFTIYSIVLLPNIIYYNFSLRCKKFVISGLMAFAILYFKVYVMTPSDAFYHTNSQGTIPYYFFWEKRPSI